MAVVGAHSHHHLGVLSYLVVGLLTIGTLIAFGLGTAVTAQTYTESYEVSCPSPAALPPDLPPQARAEALSCVPGGRQTYESTRSRTDRVWWLLAPNPFVVLADAAPALPPAPPGLSPRAQQQARQARDLDVLGQLGRTVRGLRVPPPTQADGDYNWVTGQFIAPGDRRAVWPYGLAFDVALAAGALVLSTRRLRTPSRTLPRGQRVA